MGVFGSRQTGETIRSVGALSTVGLSFVIAIVLGAWFGRTLDRWLGTGPWGFILFFFVGLAAGVLNVYRTMSRVFPPGRPPAAAPPAAPPDARGEVEPADD
jgi:ATP synthase protein I